MIFTKFVLIICAAVSANAFAANICVLSIRISGPLLGQLFCDGVEKPVRELDELNKKKLSWSSWDGAKAAIEEQQNLSRFLSAVFRNDEYRLISCSHAGEKLPISCVLEIL